jgi:anthranilate synthase component 2
MNILILDNYDSFTYNLVHMLEQFDGVQLDVIRNDKISVADVATYDKIVLSPGPGLPAEAGIMQALIKEYAATKPILGVCLGHQGIAEVFGGSLINMEKVMHGVATPVHVIEKAESLFKGLPETFLVGRYHSWSVDSMLLPEVFKITAVDDNNTVMAISHVKYPLKGVQFHPESILTENGMQMMENWLINA